MTPNHGADRAAVGDDEATEPPLLSEHRVEEPGVLARGHSVHAVVRAHDALRAAFDDRGAKMRQVVVANDLLGCVGRAGEPGGFDVVERVVLRGRHRAKVKGVVALNALHVRDGHARNERGIFAVSLLRSAPARVTRKVDDRAPEREPKASRCCRAPGLRSRWRWPLGA